MGTGVVEKQARKQELLGLRWTLVQAAVAVYLEERNIEGATFDEPLGAKTTPQQSWWLVCHEERLYPA